MADYQQYYNDPNLAQAGQNAQDAASSVAQMGQAVSLLPYKLRDAINEKLNYNKDLITQKNKAMEDYFATPSQARVDYSNIWDPQKREALVSRATAQAYTPYANLQDILSTRQGGIENLISGAGANARADLSAATDQASLLRQNYQDLLGMADKKTQLALDEARLRQSGGSSSELSGLNKIFEQLLGGGNDTSNVPPEAKPTGTPSNPAVSYHSPQGYWFYDWQTHDWVPVE